MIGVNKSAHYVLRSILSQKNDLEGSLGNVWDFSAFFYSHILAIFRYSLALKVLIFLVENIISGGRLNSFGYCMSILC